MMPLRTRPMWNGPVGFALVCSTTAGGPAGSPWPYRLPRERTSSRVARVRDSGSTRKLTYAPFAEADRRRGEEGNAPARATASSFGGRFSSCANRWHGKATSPSGPSSRLRSEKIISRDRESPSVFVATVIPSRISFRNGVQGSADDDGRESVDTTNPPGREAL